MNFRLDASGKGRLMYDFCVKERSKLTVIEGLGRSAEKQSHQERRGLSWKCQTSHTETCNLKMREIFPMGSSNLLLS